MTFRVTALSILALACGAAITPAAHADSTTYSGTFAADNSVFSLPITTTSTQNYTFETTSYATGGFVPVLTLFNTSTGAPVGFDGADGMCGAGMTASPSTGMCDDALLQETLAPGSYTLDLTEFPNVAVGNLSDGFLFASDPTATGDACGVSGGMFLQADVTPCVQLTDAYSLTVASASPTPEPGTLLLCVPVALGLVLVSRQRA